MPRKGPSTAGVNAFDPDKLSTDIDLLEKIHEALGQNDLKTAVTLAFGLPKNDSYQYRATTSITLDAVQHAVNAGPANGLHAWYIRDDANDATTTDDNEPTSTPTADNQHREIIRYPTREEIMSYVNLFDPSKPGANLLKGFKSNAKKNSLQAGIADHLTSKRHLDTTSLVVPRNKKGHSNVYSDFWGWSCISLQWAGPDASAARSHTSHPALIVAMHHFGCVCPSYEALELVKAMSVVGKGGAGKKDMKMKTVIDMGSGNGYWTYMLRRHGCEVLPVDNGQSDWRTLWIGDTIHEDGVRFLKKRKTPTGDLLLMVYPVVGLEFTTSILNSYQGNVICVAGTQNSNGYTAFKDETIDVWMARERPQFVKVAQVPLPSFAGKDDALFIWKRDANSEVKNGS